MRKPQFGKKLEELGPSVPASVLYGVTPDNQFIPINVDESGRLVAGGSNNSLFTNQDQLSLTKQFQKVDFTFLSTHIYLYNDSTSYNTLSGEPVLEFSFDGTQIHGQLRAGESALMSFRSQPAIYLRGLGSGSLVYRLMAY